MQGRAERQQEQELAATKKQSLIHQGRIVGLYQDTLLLPTKGSSTFDLVKHPGAVAILPINEEGKLLLIRQWRRAVQEILVEIPAGTLELGEEPLSCAERELREETGFQAKSLSCLGGFYTVPGFCNEYIHLFLATHLTYAPLIAEDTDDIDLFPCTWEEALHLVVTGKIRDSKTLTALFLYREYTKA
ncbi:MAG: NUDIX hydrolase [Chlamydiae bacterium]|nr:NUDIX hydrolase [Chlamydiota bacterium]